jgi:hypothetical protein
MPAPAKFLRHGESTSASTSRLTEGSVGLVRTLAMRFDSYRPELHYMRGPGPKWHAKHDPAPASTDDARSGVRTRTNAIGALVSLLRYPKWMVTFHTPFTSLALFRRQPTHQFAAAKLHSWR